MSGYYIDYAPLTPQVSFTQYQKRAGGKHIDSCEYTKRREIFNETKYNPSFRTWRNEQLKCQSYKCAWCNKPINARGIHVDHVQPVYYFGENRAYNLVLACKECNEKKRAARHGWNGMHSHTARNNKPSWIEPNCFDPELDQAFAETEKQLIA